MYLSSSSRRRHVRTWSRRVSPSRRIRLAVLRRHRRTVDRRHRPPGAALEFATRPRILVPHGGDAPSRSRPSRNRVANPLCPRRHDLGRVRAAFSQLGLSGVSGDRADRPCSGSSTTSTLVVGAVPSGSHASLRPSSPPLSAAVHHGAHDSLCEIDTLDEVVPLLDGRFIASIRPLHSGAQIMVFESPDRGPQPCTACHRQFGNTLHHQTPP